MEAAITSSVKPSTFRSYVWLLRFLKPYSWAAAGFIALSLMIIGIELSIPKFMQVLIDDLLPSGKTAAFGILLGVAAAMIAVMIVSTLVRNRLQKVIQEKAARELQVSLLDHLRRLGFSYYERHPTGETLSLFNTDISAVQQIYYRYLPGMIISGITFILSASFMLTIHPTLSLIAVPCFLSYYLIGPYFEKRAARLGKETQENRAAYQKKIYDTVSGLLELRVHRAEKWDTESGLDRQSKLHRSTNRLHAAAYGRGLVRRVSVQFGAVAVFAYGAYLLEQGSVSTGALVAFMFFYFRMIQDLTFLVTMTSEQQVLMHQVHKLYELAQQQGDVTEARYPQRLHAVRGEISFRHVSFRYPGQPALIENITLSIRPGEKVALVGESGNGKSTLIKLVGRFYDPQSGEIRLDDVPLPELSLRQVRESIGFVFQETYLYGTTIRENIRFGNPDATDMEIEKAAKAAFAHDFIMEFPQGYDTFVGERGVRLSGGQRQRISIARMFVKDPRIVVLDEATSALDNVSEREIRQALDVLLQGRTTLAVAHRLSTIRHFDNIVVLAGGGIVETGTYEQLMERKGSFYRLATGERK